MKKNDYYVIEKNIDKVIRGEYTNFLDFSMFKKVCAKLKGYDYKIYYPYNESEKCIIYNDEIPEIELLEIISSVKLKHNEIMGSLYGTNISSEMFGDIIIYNDHYYIMVMSPMVKYLKDEFYMVGNKKISLKEVSLDVLNKYKRHYKKLELIVSNVRIDIVICRLLGESRSSIKKKFLNDEVIVNYEVCHKLDYNLNENDIFSVRKYGKYKFGGIIKNTKRDNYIIKLYKYIDN